APRRCRPRAGAKGVPTDVAASREHTAELPPELHAGGRLDARLRATSGGIQEASAVAGAEVAASRRCANVHAVGFFDRFRSGARIDGEAVHLIHDLAI